MIPSTLDDGGLVCGFRLRPVEALDPATFPLQQEPGGRPLWLHFNLADNRAHLWLKEQAGLRPDIVEVLLEPDPRIHFEVDDDAIVAVLADRHHDLDDDPDGFGKLRLYANADRIITVRSRRLQTSDRLRRELQGGKASFDSAGQLIHGLLDRLTETFGKLVAKLGDEVDSVEDTILGGRFRAHGKILGHVRRDIARLRRHANANRIALAPLRGHVPSWLAAELDGIRDALGRLDTLAQDLQLVEERTRLLQEEIAARLNEGTNKSLALLSTVTTALLPITLITGIFGMNVGGLPGLSSPHGFRWVMVSILAAVAVSLVGLFRGREK